MISMRFPTDTVAGMSQEELSVMMQGNSITDAPWIAPIAKYVEILQIVAALSPANANTLAKKMYLELEPSFATPDSILTIIDRFEKLEQQIIDMILTESPEHPATCRTTQRLQKVYKISKPKLHILGCL